jgi:hypothetical protein
MALSKHDRKVAAIAGGLAANGWRVKADLPNRTLPPVINGFRPDVYAVKGQKRLAVEVETPQSYHNEHSKGQRRAGREWAERSSNNKFRATRTR